MSVLHHHLRDSGFHEGCVRQEKLVLLLTELDTRLAQRRETLQKRVTGPEDLLAAPVSQQTRITCPTPTSVEHANIRVKSYNLNSRERYVCNSGFKRKAGTSSLTECVFNKTMNIAHWTTPNLKCIRDPSLTHQRPPPMTTPAGVTPGPESHISSGKGRNVGNFFRTPIPCYHQDPTEPSDSCRSIQGQSCDCSRLRTRGRAGRCVCGVAPGVLQKVQVSKLTRYRVLKWKAQRSCQWPGEPTQEGRAQNTDHTAEEVPGDTEASRGHSEGPVLLQPKRTESRLGKLAPGKSLPGCPGIT
ncbi:Interleukin-15 receptor subunit alpha [Camelus dromedarius]|uniref:Interleukin-15 receptor subunit alpha n=1 Tax=Camelus dromedarius TaxID=9838 RepID=A0A5N4C514_CAMDR|nr:Interleukin-15 receptor subunit alpha [Camelus dromedarius]